jgi:large subunit ribosomal protein L4
MELKVYGINGNETGRTVIVNEELFGTEPNDHVIWLAVRQYLADQRQGTHN